MPDDRQKLEKTIVDLQTRWGSQIVRRGSLTTAVPAISTSFPALDAALGVGGVPRGRFTEIGGVPTSGMATLALKVIATAQAQGGTAVYLDAARAFDAEYAARCDVKLNRLVIVRPYTARQGIQMLPEFLVSGGPTVLVCDSALFQPDTVDFLATTVGRLSLPLAQSGCALICLRSLPGEATASPLAHHAALRLRICRERWLYRQGDVAGYEAQVYVERNKAGQEARQARIAITFA